MIRHLYSAFLILSMLLAIILFPSCKSRQADYRSIKLTDWEVDIGQGFIKCKPVAWEKPVEEGGIGLKHYDGFGTYRTEVVIPEDMRSLQLALFIQNIDDADKTFFNNVNIGETGSFPSQDMDCISAWRKPRVYVIPQNLINYDTQNFLEIKVFNNSGKGGLTGYMLPEISEFHELNKLALSLQMINDIPRIAVLTTILLFVLKFIFQIAYRCNKDNFFYIARRLWLGLNPLFFIQAAIRGTNNLPSLTGEIKFKHFCSVIALVAFFIFIFSELTIEDMFFISQFFPMRYHPIALYAGFTALSLMIHCDVFLPASGRKTLKWKLTLRMFLGLLTHPLVLLLYIFYNLLLPVNIASNSFVAQGSSIVIVMLCALLCITFLRFYNIDTEDNQEVSFRIMTEDSYAKIFFLLGCIVTIIVYLKTKTILYTHSSVIALFFIILYIYISTHIEQKRMVLYHALEEKTKQLTQRITSSEEKINKVIDFIEKNYVEPITRDEIAKAVDMSPDHLSHIFKTCTGKSVTDFINEIRIKQSLALLSKTNKAVIAIAYEVGFTSLRTFNRSFLKIMKESPTQYKNNFCQ